MKKITLLLSSLFFFSLGTSACSDEAPSGNTEKPELPVNPEPPVTPSETLKGSFESKFVRYAKGQKFTGQEDDRLVTTVWKDTVWQNERVHKQIVLWTESKRYDDLTYEIGDLLSGGNRIASSNLHCVFHPMCWEMKRLLFAMNTARILRYRLRISCPKRQSEQ